MEEAARPQKTDRDDCCRSNEDIRLGLVVSVKSRTVVWSAAQRTRDSLESCLESFVVAFFELLALADARSMSPAGLQLLGGVPICRYTLVLTMRTDHDPGTTCCLNFDCCADFWLVSEDTEQAILRQRGGIVSQQQPERGNLRATGKRSFHLVTGLPSALSWNLSTYTARHRIAAQSVAALMLLKMTTSSMAIRHQQMKVFCTECLDGIGRSFQPSTSLSLPLPWLLYYVTW